MSQAELFVESPRDTLLRQLDACEFRRRGGWYVIVHPESGQVIPGARVDFEHPQLEKKNTPYRPMRFRTRREARESLARLKEDVRDGTVIVGEGR